MVEHGTPYETIRSYADHNDIDLIAMGTHGRTEVDRFLLGSVTERVIRKSGVPVLTSRLEPVESVDSSGYDRILDTSSEASSTIPTSEVVETANQALS